MSTVNNVRLDAGEVKIDADPAVLAAVVHGLINNEEYRKLFERNPVECLEECGVTVPREYAKKITPESIDIALKDLTKRGPEGEEIVAVLVAPGVLPAVRIATRPATRPGVSIGVRVFTQSTTFSHSAEEQRRMDINEAPDKKPGKK